MKCECERCFGSGRVECPECDGIGTFEGSISNITLLPSHKHYDELLALREDAQRVTRQASELVALNPGRIESYQAQLKAALFVIEGEATALTKRK